MKGVKCMSKKIVRMVLVLLATVLVMIPLTANAGFDLGGALKKIPGVSTNTSGKRTPRDEVGKQENRPMAGVVMADGVPAEHFAIMVGQGIRVEIKGQTLVIHGEIHDEGATDKNGSIKEASIINGGPYTIVIWSAGYQPIIRENVMSPSDLGRMNTTKTNIKFIDYQKY
jgi:hypothetical protein